MIELELSTPVSSDMIPLEFVSLFLHNDGQPARGGHGRPIWEMSVYTKGGECKMQNEKVTRTNRKLCIATAVGMVLCLVLLGGIQSAWAADGPYEYSRTSLFTSK